MKKKFLALAMVMVLGMTVLAGCGESKSDASSTNNSNSTNTVSTDTNSTGLLASIKKSGKLVVGTASGYPPYEFVDTSSANQDVIGIDMELAKAVAHKLGVKLEIQDMTFSSLLASIPTHKIDMAIAGISPTDERKKTVDFSDTYLTADQKILVLKKNASKYKTLNDFAGKTVSAEKSTTQEKLAQDKLTSSKLTSLEKLTDCILELQNEKVDGIVVESIVGEQYVKANPNIVFSSASFGAQKFSAIAIDKGNEDLLKILNEVIKENKTKGNFNKWVKEYSEKAAKNAK